MRILAAAILLALPACEAMAETEVAAMPSADVTGTLFVANKRGASLSRIDLASGEEAHRNVTCDNPHELTVSPDAKFVAVACYSGRQLQIFRTGDLAAHGSITLGENARIHSALWLENGRIVAGAEGRGSLYILDDSLTDGSSAIEVVSSAAGDGPGPHLIAVSADGRTAWGTIIPRGEVVRYDIDEHRETNRRRIGNAIEAIALSPDGESLWVASNEDSIAYRLDPETLEIEAEVATGEVPIRLAMHPSGEFVVSSNFGSGDLTVIDTATNEVVRTIEVSGSREAVQVTLVFSEDGERLYAAETAADAIAEIDFASGEVLRRLPTGPGGDGLAVVD